MSLAITRTTVALIVLAIASAGTTQNAYRGARYYSYLPPKGFNRIDPPADFLEAYQAAPQDNYWPSIAVREQETSGLKAPELADLFLYAFKNGAKGVVSAEKKSYSVKGKREYYVTSQYKTPGKKQQTQIHAIFERGGRAIVILFVRQNNHPKALDEAFQKSLASFRWL